MSSRRPFSAASFSASFSFIASRRLRVMRSSSSARSSDAVAGGDLLLDHLPLEGGRHRDEAEGRMGDDHRVPVRRRRAGEEPRALLLHEVGLVGDQDAGGRVELQELARDLRQAVAGHDQHGLADQAEPLLLHDRAGDGVGFSGADGMRDVGRAGRDDAPDHPLLVLVEADDAAGAGQGQVPPVEVARHQVVEAVVVDARQPVGAVGIGPDPAGEGLLDLAPASPWRPRSPRC